MADDDRCGTKAGASAHNRRGEPRCDACRAYRAANREEINARRRAAWRCTRDTKREED